ncbi:RNA-directed DNA polymerase-like protein [Plakobranchus ocellatus]|uniref:RNA-directed DNA polymerase-like protein n=1 Tax=Plakobranchus ocellatus TaxID=259542 RepID=A0AAV3Y764_9GAST|nr:RNA-directed DNA polymerase-like protein [Plakobranchus ocellatus]
MANALPHFPPFKIREDELSAGTRWKKWFQKFENLITALDITDEKRKKALLVHYGGDEILDLPNHFAKECRSKPKAAKVRQVEENEISDEDVFSIKSNKKVPTATIKLDDHPVSCIVDTGASVNILTKATFTKLKKKPVLRPSSTAIFGYNSDQRLRVLGCFTTTVKHRQKNTTAKFFVVDGNSSSSNLLSGDTSEKLGLIK